jgi:hypothetical protein
LYGLLTVISPKVTGYFWAAAVPEFLMRRMIFASHSNSGAGVPVIVVSGLSIVGGRDSFWEKFRIFSF